MKTMIDHYQGFQFHGAFPLSRFVHHCYHTSTDTATAAGHCSLSLSPGLREPMLVMLAMLLASLSDAQMALFVASFTWTL